MTRDELMDEGFEKALTFEDKYLQPKACFQYGYVAGAEPREKRIAELEKENAELLCQKNRNKSCYSCANATERCFKNEIGCPCQNYKSYKEENAELKDYRLTTLAKQQTENQKYTVNLEHKLSWYDDQLTKTKELLRMVIDSYNHKERFSFEKDLMKAEQFLNDSKQEE